MSSVERQALVHKQSNCSEIVEKFWKLEGIQGRPQLLAKIWKFTKWIPPLTLFFHFLEKAFGSEFERLFWTQSSYWSYGATTTTPPSSCHFNRLSYHLFGSSPIKTQIVP